MIPNDVSKLDLARNLNHPTPFFYTHKEILLHNFKTFSELFHNEEVCYALKANSDPKILTYLDSIGCSFEAASIFEIEQLLSLGVEPHKIVYGTAVKPAWHIKTAFDSGINRFAVDSKEEAKKVAENAPGSKVFVRTTVDDNGSVFTMSERFGADVTTVLDIMLYAKRLELKTYGISFYVGSQAVHADLWAKAIKTIRPVIEALVERGIVLEVLNMGGGFPVHYNNHNPLTLKEIVADINKELHKLPYLPKILLEPGRGIVASSTLLVVEVFSRTVRNGKVWLCVDGGIYNALYEAMIHQGATSYQVHPLVEPTGEHKTMECVIAGPTGDSLDIITKHAILPEYITIGDKLMFDNAGAYTISMSSSFNGFPPPKLYIS